MHTDAVLLVNGCRARVSVRMKCCFAGPAGGERNPLPPILRALCRPCRWRKIRMPALPVAKNNPCSRRQVPQISQWLSLVYHGVVGLTTLPLSPISCPIHRMWHALHVWSFMIGPADKMESVFYKGGHSSLEKKRHFCFGLWVV